MACVICYDALRRPRATVVTPSVVRCPRCVAAWCTPCHEKLTMAFVKHTIERIDDLDVRGMCLTCPCCRRPLDATAIGAPLHNSYLRHYVDGIYQFAHELQRMDTTLHWLRTHPTWNMATRDHARVQAEIDQFDSIIDTLQHAMLDEMRCLKRALANNHWVLQSSCPTCTRDGAPRPTGESTECAPCQSRRRLADLQAECTAMRFIRDRNRADLQQSLRHTPHLFASYCSVDAMPISDALHSLTGARRMPPMARWDKHGAPMTFFTFLPQRVGYLLGVHRRSELLMAIVHDCRRRNLLRDLIEGLRLACRTSSRTGVRRWLERVDLSPCPYDARFQSDFMRCVEDVVRGNDRSA
jgi:hypothetical protein